MSASGYEIVELGDPRLREHAKPVDLTRLGDVLPIAQAMREWMDKRGGVGIAAPQIGVGLQMMIIASRPNPRYPDAPLMQPLLLLNPLPLRYSDHTVEEWEGCLSVPGLRGLVPRHARLRYQGFTERGEPIDRKVSGFHARVVQHECDHLDGILYPQRIRDLRHFGYTDVLFPGAPIDDD